MSEESCPRPEDLAAFVLGTLPELLLERIARHLDRCGSCEANVNALDQISDPLIAGLRRSPASGDSGATWIGSAGGRALRRGPVAGNVLPERLGDYRIIRELGRGGMGIVYEAEQVSLGRRVALKVLPGHALLDRKAVERFRREARAAGRLHHTNIVPVFGTGEQDGYRYFVMQLIPGPGLDRVIRELGRLQPAPAATSPAASATDPAENGALAALAQKLRSGWPASAPGGDSGSGSDPAHDSGAGASSAVSAPTPHTAPAATAHTDTTDSSSRAYWVSVARLGIQVADALAFAHAQGVVHRDIKPSNLLLDPHGRLWITDFGLAKEAAAPENLTRSDLLVGTLRYVPPERFRGGSDARGDIYGLGITLYELLTFRPAFPESEREKLVHQVMNTEPPRPRRLNPDVPRDLETVVLKAIARDPAHRYQSAADLAEDLRRFVADRPIRARRFTWLELVWRAARRDPVRATLTGALLLACLAGVIGVATQWWRAEDRARREAEARVEATDAAAAARRNLYFSQIAQARLEWRANNVAGAEHLLELSAPALRGWEWHYLRGITRPDLLMIPAAGPSITNDVAFSPDGRLLALTGWEPYPSRDGSRHDPVQVWDLSNGRRLPVPPGLPMALGLSFSPDGQLVAASDDKGNVLIWQPETGKKVTSLTDSGFVTLIPDGKVLATSGAKEVVFWDVHSCKRINRFPSAGGRVTFSPDRRFLAVSAADAVVLHDATTGRQVRRLPHGPSEAAVRQRRYFGEAGADLAFSPDGKLLVVATSPPRLWHVPTGQLRHTLIGHDFDVAGVAFGPDGRHVASAGSDGTVRLWDVETGSETMVLRGHRSHASHVAFHPDGWCLASVGRQPGDVKIWDLTRQPDYANLPAVDAQAVSFLPGSNRVAVVGIQGDLRVFDLTTGHLVREKKIDLVQQWLTPACPVIFSADGRRLVTVSNDRRVIKVFTSDGRQIEALRGLTVPGLFVAASADGGRVAAAALDNQARPRAREIRVWDTASGATLCTHHPAAGPTPWIHGVVALSPDGERLAFDDYMGKAARVRLVEAKSGRELASLPLASNAILCITFSADGHILAAGDDEGNIAVWRASSGRRLQDKYLRGPAFRLAFSPDGRRLAGVDRDQAKVWDVETSTELLTLHGAPPRTNDGGFNPVLSWSPDGRWLAAGMWDGSLSLWDGGDRPPPGFDPTALRRLADGRAYHWHLTEAEAAAAARQPVAMEFHLKRLAGHEPPDIRARLRRARLLAYRGLAKQATEDLVAAFAAKAPDDGVYWLIYARVLLAQGDVDGYRRLYVRMLAHPTSAFDASWPSYLLHVGAAGPSAFEKAASSIRQYGKIIGDNTSDAHQLWLLGLAYYRAGEADKAIVQLKRFDTASADRAWLCWPVLAMACRKQGLAGEARRWLEKCAVQHEKINQQLAEPTGGFALPEMWQDFEVLYAEARNVLGRELP
jgi:WD40 repeat protein/serine/threonine protein kinase/tetratricopeptide (TPR) repeat protein